MITLQQMIVTPYSGRLESMAKVLPFLEGKRTAVYVGAKGPDGGFFLRELIAKYRFAMTIVEPWAPNAEEVRRNFPDCRVVTGTVQEFLASTDETFDVFMWWHGPEHAPADELPNLIEKIKLRTDVVILGCPFGDYPQDGSGGNPFEIHQTCLVPEFFNSLGMSTWTLEYSGGKGGPGTHITTWWIKEDAL